MSMSRSARIWLLLFVDVIFFFVELITGYAVGSLALVADSFHMLNDVISLIVALYAIKLSNGGSVDSRYSYGWHRAEILAALINGVFLLALCFSISLEALERFFNTSEISNPKLIVVVGSLGLASNIFGLLLFHEHGHSHDHSHGQASSHSRTSSSATQVEIGGDATPTQKKAAHGHSHSRPVSEATTGSYPSMYGQPAATRASIVQTANDIASARSPSARRQSPSSIPFRASNSPTTPQLPHGETEFTEDPPSPSTYVDEGTPLLHERRASERGHSHAGSMNMRALILHVVGDALGNVGVIATGLVIWLTSWSFKDYFDPFISLFITVIIFSSALPLVKSASFILLQGVPSTVSFEEVKESILAVDGVLSLHELHVWQLSETKIVASVHVLASPSHDFMPIAANIRKELHHLGIHSSTIQPEYSSGTNPSNVLDQSTDKTSCLILCPVDQQCDPSENACCPPPSIDV